ncbi:unnamed protein product [Blepharisma stoltei]|uniref:Uncharacterized protein n=1 Tax=Blepharisma stoltei TaxID=1481888 RepID=A0AAU9K9S0_9CILI|nr:unnamed protein product [Blepharisma stoltei]
MQTADRSWLFTKKTLFLPLTLFSASVLVMIISLTAKKWSTLDQGEISNEMSLYRCKNCVNYLKDWSWKCFSDYCYYDDSSSGNCIAYNNGSKASFFYFSFEIIAIISGLMVVEKIILVIFDKNYGGKIILCLLAAFMLIAHVMAIYIWSVLNDANWYKSNEECSIEKPCVYAENGPFLAFANIFICSFAFISLMILIWKQRENISNSEPLARYIWFIRVELLLIIVGLLFFILFLIVIFTVYHEEWVERHTKDNLWRGGLSSCVACEPKIPDFDWECLVARECFVSPSSKSCKLYSHMFNAYKLYIFFDGLALLCSVFFIQTYIYFLNRKIYGSAYMTYIYAILLSVFHITATVLWFMESDVALDSHCNKKKIKPHKHIFTCSRLGPHLLMVSNFFSIFMTALYCYIFYKRNYDYKSIIKLQESQEQGISKFHEKSRIEDFKNNTILSD